MSKSDLKPKKVKGRVEVLQVMPYKGSNIYIRKIDKEIFMYDLVFKGEIYSSYIIMKPRNGTDRLSKSEINQAAALIFTGACATVDYLNGNTEKIIKKSKLSREQLERVADLN